MKLLLRFALRRSQAFNIVEVLICLAVLFVLAGLLLPGLVRPRVNHSRINCVNNLKQVGLAFRIWAGDNNDQFPMQVSLTNGGVAEVASDVWRTFQLMSNELVATEIILCRTDDRNPPESWEILSNTNISYFVGLDAKQASPEMVLAGDRNVTNGLATTNHMLAVTKGRNVGWTEQLHNNQGNIALADGSVLQFTSGKLLAQFRQATNAVQRLAIPE